MYDASIDLMSSVSFIIFSSDSCLLDLVSCFLYSISSFIMSNFSSYLLSILLLHFGILKPEV